LSGEIAGDGPDRVVLSFSGATQGIWKHRWKLGVDRTWAAEIKRFCLDRVQHKTPVYMKDIEERFCSEALGAGLGRAIWGRVLFLLENAETAGHGPPRHFRPFNPLEPVFSLPEWRELYQEAVASTLLEPGRPISDMVRAVHQMLCRRYPAAQLRQLPLKSVAAFLRETRERPAEAAGVAAAAPIGAGRDEGGPVTQATRGPSPSAQGRGMTLEEQVGRFLAENPRASMEEVKTATGQTQGRIQRRKAWKDHNEGVLRDFLESRPEAMAGDVQAILGFSPAKTVGMQAWKARRECKKADGPVRQVKERPLTVPILESRPDKGSSDPAKRCAQREEVFQRILEMVNSATRTTLSRLADADEGELVDHVIGCADEVARAGLDAESAAEILREVVASWLDDREQKRCRGSRGGS
jgi:hypothetical protein